MIFPNFTASESTVFLIFEEINTHIRALHLNKKTIFAVFSWRNG